MMQRANLRVREILAQHQPDYLSTAADSAIRQRFNIIGF
jgi:trimethylamine:corrinoid methyltransferase-like protein